MPVPVPILKSYPWLESPPEIVVACWPQGPRGVPRDAHRAVWRSVSSYCPPADRPIHVAWDRLWIPREWLSDAPAVSRTPASPRIHPTLVIPHPNRPGHWVVIDGRKAVWAYASQRRSFLPIRPLSGTPVFCRGRTRLARLMRRDGTQCVSCGKPLWLTPPRWMSSVDWEVLHRPTVDHRMPRALGGATVWENLQLLCMQCNQDKGAIDPALWHPHAMARRTADLIWQTAWAQPSLTG